MDADEYQQELQKCRERLAAELDREDVPDAAWGHVMKLELPYDVITHGGKESWRELVEETKAYLKEMSEGVSSSFPPGRSEERGALPKVAVEPSEYSRKRAQAFSEVAATLAGKHPKVKRFRRWYLGDEILADEEANALLEDQGEPYDRRRHILKNLYKLADKLVKTYRWRESEAVWFVLTGSAPQVRPLQVTTSVSESIVDHHPDTVRITLTADAWVNAEEVQQVFRDVQRQILRGDARPLPDHTLEVVAFVARRMREHGEESWRKRWEAWNETCPKEWRYGSYRGFRQVFERFIHRRYGWPRYKTRHRLTPMWYQPK